MSEFRINFKLQTELDKIAPFGEKGRYSLSWFGLTDSLLWITAGDSTVYEYLQSARDDISYNDYYLSRFLEDFSGIFGSVAEPISRELFDGVESFDALTQRELDKLDEDDPAFDEKYDEILAQREWFTDRIFDSGHLRGGPDIGCFRCGERLKFYWNSTAEDLWTSPRGSFELPYRDFVSAVKRFFGEFYAQMDEQVKRALDKDWGEIKVDKEYLLIENSERKIGFDQGLALL